MVGGWWCKESFAYFVEMLRWYFSYSGVGNGSWDFEGSSYALFDVFLLLKKDTKVFVSQKFTLDSLSVTQSLLPRVGLIKISSFHCGTFLQSLTQNVFLRPRTP